MPEGYPNESIPFIIRGKVSAILGTYWALGYFTLGAWKRSGRTFDPSISLDRLIPFVGWGVWIYLFGILWIALPAVTINTPGLFRQISVSYFSIINFAFLCFFLFPTEVVSLRRDVSTAHLDCVTAWSIHKLHLFDPSTNLLPSLHVSLATVATLALARQYPVWRVSSFAVLIAIIVSVCISKQHTIVDAIAGVIVALTVFGITTRLKVYQ